MGSLGRLGGPRGRSLTGTAEKFGVSGSVCAASEFEGRLRSLGFRTLYELLLGVMNSLCPLNVHNIVHDAKSVLSERLCSTLSPGTVLTAFYKLRSPET